MGVAVQFNYANWAATFPQFSPALDEATVTNLILPIAEIYCRNDGGGPVSKAETQTVLLNLMVAHVAQLMYGPKGEGITGAGGSGIVGRISSATEGSVSVSAEFPTTPNNAWFLQTTFGAAFWQATAAYRTMRYIPGPRRNMNPWLNQ
ncbi:hypothetical protein ACVITL_002805 [Rhizobium pisi]